MAQFALTEEQVVDLEQLLLAQELQLKANLGAALRIEDSAHALISANSDADWTTADVEADALITGAARHATALADTSAALKKITDGQYGVCETCGEAIGYTRLLAYSGARRCLTCQRSEEARLGASRLGKGVRG